MRNFRPLTEIYEVTCYIIIIETNKGTKKMNAYSNSTNTLGAINRRARRVFLDNARAMVAVKEGHAHVLGASVFFVTFVVCFIVFTIV